MSGAPAESARIATATDLDRLVELAVDAVDEQRDARGGPVWSRRESRREPAQSLAAALGDPDQFVVAGLLDDAIMGYAVLRIEQLTDGGLLAVVDDLYVEAGGRGVGLGETMMNLLVAHATERGCFGIDALALPGNRATKNFFETFGLTARAIVVHRTLDSPGS
jgi:ribosomal protein S18 acetylase RimI-like enzyme